MLSRCSLAQPARLQAIELRGTVAWAETAAGVDAIRQARFYRQTGHGGNLHVRRRGLPYIGPLVERTAQEARELCAILECSPGKVLDVQFTILHSQGDAGQAPLLALVLQRHGTDSLPALLRWLRQPRSLSSFAQRWLPAFPSEQDAFVETVAAMAVDAIYAGRTASSQLLVSLLYSEPTRFAEWVARQEMEPAN